MSITWPSWKSLSPNSVISLSFCSMRADEPLKSKRVPISFAVWSTAFFTSTRLGSRTVSKLGICQDQGAKQISENSLMHVESGVSLRPYIAFGLPAVAHTLVRVKSDADVRQVVDHPQLGRAPKFILGGGSNIVLTRDMPQLVVKVEVMGRRLVEERADAWIVEAGAGENWHDFVMWTIEQGLPGLENLALIPGTVGAAPVQNIRAYGVQPRE